MNLWWNQVPNAVRYVAEIKECLLEEKSILLKYANGMPWREEFTDDIKMAVKLQNSDKKFVTVPGVSDPGKYLLEEFVAKEKRTEYRPGKGYAKFFAEKDDIVLHNRFFWVKTDDAAILDAWMIFVTEYVKECGKRPNKAVFILEWMKEDAVSPKKGIRLFSFEDFIGEYDRLVFSVLASSSIRESSFIKNYLAEMVSNVIGNDIELCGICIGNYKAFLADPAGFIKAIVREQTRSDGSAFEYATDENGFNTLVWRAQIKSIYPHLEEYREEFVQKHYSVILKQLPITDSFGETISDPKEVELGMLVYMVGMGAVKLDDADYKTLCRFKDARNKLSHLTTLSYDEIKALM